MTNDQGKREIVERVAWKIQEKSPLIEQHQVVIATHLVLEAANHFELREAAKQALEDIAAYRRFNSIVPANVPDGPTEKALRAALKGGE